MLSWLRRRAKPITLLGLLGLLGQSPMFCCLSSANAATRISAVTAVTGHYPLQQEAVKAALPNAVGHGKHHCPHGDKNKTCCGHDVRAMSGSDGVPGNLVQTVDFNPVPPALPANELTRVSTRQQPFPWLGSPPALARPDIFLIHCAFLE